MGCLVSRITGYMLFYLSCFAGVAKSVRSSCIVNVRASETSMSGVVAPHTPPQVRSPLVCQKRL